MDTEYIWLFGENLGTTANNNSYYFWRHVVKKKDGIRKYIVLEKSNKNLQLYKGLDKDTQKMVLWRNSLNHVMTYLKADMYFVTLSYKDISPDRFLWKEVNWPAKKPVVYLQHGTLAIKQLGYRHDSYNNNLFRFIYYNPEMNEKMQKVNGMKAYQLYYGIYHPRYTELTQRYDRHKLSPGNIPGKRLFWFLTWREYLSDKYKAAYFVRQITWVINNQRLQSYLEENSAIITICLHQFLKKDLLTNIESERIKIVTPDSVDIMDYIAEYDVLITDYSSLGFDFSFLQKPVILYQPDLDFYLSKRKLYCDVEELRKHSIESPQELISVIVDEKYGQNPFFTKRLPEQIDYEYVRHGKQIDRMYEYFITAQTNKVTFLGYHFYGVGGTVFATWALAEALMEKGYLVELLSLTKRNEPKNPPSGIAFTCCYDGRNWKRVKKVELLKRLIRNPAHFNYLNYDPSRELLIPYAELGLRRQLKKIRSKTVISTRESLHLFLYDASSPYIRNKIYFFHTPANWVNELFPGLFKQLDKVSIEHASFVTDNNRIELQKTIGYNNYEDYAVVGNSLCSSRCLEKDEIHIIEKKDIYSGIFLLRISKERKGDIDNLISFGKYLHDNCIEDIRIDVYGSGDALDYFFSELFSNNLSDVIMYKGVTNSVKETIAEYDALVDFSLSQSFGMTCIEGVLNGKMVYCMKNTGSLEVLRDIPECFISSYADLVEKMRNLPNLSLEDFQRHYDLVSSRYSRQVVADKFIDAFSL